MENINYPKYKICVSGAAETGRCGDKAFEIARELGKEVIRQGAVFVDGATTGFPYWAAKGAKEEGGIVVGVSPASSKSEHVLDFKLPIDYHDIIMYTGQGYSGRNLLLTRMADAVICGCGRMGTMNEFTIAFEDKKPIGIIEGEWETDEVFRMLIEKSYRGDEMKDKIFFGSDPKQVVEEVLKRIKMVEAENHIELE